MAWNMEILVIVSTLVLWFIFYKRITPLAPIVHEKSIHAIIVADVTPDLTAPSSGLSSLSGRQSKNHATLEIYNASKNTLK